MNRDVKAHKTLTSHSQKYMKLQQEYDSLRWQMLTTTSQWGMLRIGAKLFVNQMRNAKLLGGKALQSALDVSALQDHQEFASLRHAASYYQDYSFWQEARLNVLRIESYRAWEDAKAKSDFNIVAKPFEKLLSAQFNRQARGASYQGALEQNSRGLQHDDVSNLMRDTFRTHIQLQSALMKRGNASDNHVLQWPASKEAQEKIVKRILQDMGVDLARLSYLEGAHPACFGYYDDVSMSMAYDLDDVLMTCLTAFHEGGHVLYRQNLPQQFKGTAAGFIAGRDMDEAMALFWEHAVSHNEGFAHYLARVICEETDAVLRIEADDIYNRIMALRMGYMRGEADAVNYPIQLIQRHGIAEDLVRGKLAVSDLRQAFNESAVSYLGQLPKNDRDGVLQDPHWFAGEFTDFDNYFMGQNYALQLYDTMRLEYTVPALNHDLADGNFAPITQWLAQNIWQHGALKTSKEIVEDVSQKPLSVGGYKNFVTTSYGL